jgi:hypothetical protein
MVRAASTFLLACLAAAAAWASVDAPGDLVEQAKGANRVAVATVTDVASAFAVNEFGDQLIVSRVTFRVEETMKGSSQATVEVMVEGGTVGDLTLEVSDLPRMEPGKRAVLFLTSAPDGRQVPYRRGRGLLELTADDRVEGTGLTLADIRAAVRAAAGR